MGNGKQSKKKKNKKKKQGKGKGKSNAGGADKHSWVQAWKKGKGNGRGHVLGSSATKYSEIPVPVLSSFERGENQDAVAYATLSRIGKMEQQRKLKLENQRERELEAMTRYNANKPTKSQLLAREIKQNQELHANSIHTPTVASIDGPFNEFPPAPFADDVCEVVVHEVPADNSCLFHAVAYLARRPSAPSPQEPAQLRRLVADRMKQEQQRWNAVTLAESRTVEEYITWIADPASWGGFVDLIVLSECMQVQISVLSIETLYWMHYPDDVHQYERRMYMFYDGVHYNGVVGKSRDGYSELRLFNPTDETTMEKVLSLGRLQQVQEAVVYSCEQCGLTVVGSAEVTRHSFETGHNNFCEIDLAEHDDARECAGSEDIEGDGAEDGEEVEDQDEEDEEDEDDEQKEPAVPGIAAAEQNAAEPK